MDFRRLVVFIMSLLIWLISFSQITGKIIDTEGNPLQAMVFVEGGSKSTNADKEGNYSLNLASGQYQLVAFVPGYNSLINQVNYNGTRLQVDFTLKELSTELEAVTVEGSRTEDLGISWLQSVEGTTIYEAKKTELISLDDVTANLATNTSRQVYARVPGLNIFENDGVGLQLAIGARGLDPNRSSNFNVRQNGYDISADALGYPESYYTPPVAALQRIEIIRGAAGLQYGPQFGGLLNFKFKEGPKDKKLKFTTANTAGSFGLLNTFNSFGGTIGKVNYYSFYQYKRSTGWRPNSDLGQHTAFGSFKYNFTPFMDLKLEFTHMNYLAQQPGGLTDTQFGQDPTLSTRFRNWFQVGWNSGAVNFNYRINSKIKINNRTFFLKANRYSLGDLGTAIVLNQNRTLIKDDFTNWGNEFRLSYNYDFIGNKSVLLIGNRYYQGFTDSSQGDGTSESNADFDYVGGNPSLSDYDFPSRNVSVFAENIFNISDKFSITPGLRYEFIRTEADGSFTNQVRNFAGEVIFEETTFEQREDQRDFLLYGLGLSYKLDEEKEVYLNYSRNYRGINFTDIRVDIPFLVVDPDISDESGFNLDLGIRGSKKDSYLYDLSLFYLSYEDRIGNTLVRTDTTLRTFTYRTNIGDAAIVGFESYAEVHVPSSPFIVFTNFAWIVSEYTKILEFGTSLGDLVKGNNVELVPAINLKTGLKYQGDKLKGSLLFSYVSSQFSDAANTKETNTGIEGRIPAYKILDLSLTYPWKNITFGTGINNLLDEQYFSRRAAGYPGPGLIPSQPRSIYLSVEARF